MCITQSASTYILNLHIKINVIHKRALLKTILFFVKTFTWDIFETIVHIEKKERFMTTWIFKNQSKMDFIISFSFYFL
jgi:hypothetical protein